MAWLKMELDMEAENRRRPRSMGAEAAGGAVESQDYGNTYEIFMQPNFRDNFDAWRDTPLEQMDNRNLSEQEKKQIEDSRRATLAKRAKKDPKVIQDIDDLDETNDQGLTQKETKIVRQERKKRIVNHMLCETVRQVDDRQVNLVSDKSWWERLVHTAPAAFQF